MWRWMEDRSVMFRSFSGPGPGVLEMMSLACGDLACEVATAAVDVNSISCQHLTANRFYIKVELPTF